MWLIDSFCWNKSGDALFFMRVFLNGYWGRITKKQRIPWSEFSWWVIICICRRSTSYYNKSSFRKKFNHIGFSNIKWRYPFYISWRFKVHLTQIWKGNIMKEDFSLSLSLQVIYSNRIHIFVRFFNYLNVFKLMVFNQLFLISSKCSLSYSIPSHSLIFLDDSSLRSQILSWYLIKSFSFIKVLCSINLNIMFFQNHKSRTIFII
jgi:hypothetical protein